MNKNNKYYQLTLNTLLFCLGNFGSKFLIFILMPLYTNVLTTAEYGISELVITGTNLLIPFVSVSIQDATLRFALDRNNESGEVLKNTVFVLILATFCMLLLYPLLSLYKAISGWTQYLLILTIVYMIRNALSIYLKAIGRVKLFSIDSIFYTLILMISNIVFLVYADWGLRGYFYASIFSTLCSIVFLIISGDVIKSCVNSQLNFKLLKDMLLFSFPMIFNNISWWIIGSSDKVMIEYFISISAAGIYSVASKIPSVLTTFTNIFNQAWVISSVTEYDSTKDSKFYSNIFLIFNFILLVATSIITMFIEPFIQWYVGPDFVESWKYIPLLLLGSVFQSYSAFFGAIYTSAKKNISVMTTTVIAAFINILLNILLISIMGIQGAVISTVIAYFLIFVFRMIDSQKYVKFKLELGQTLFSILIVTVQCIFTIFLNGYLRYIISSLCLILLFLVNYKILIRLFGKIFYKKYRN